jgi:hypothetical protein
MPPFPESFTQGIKFVSIHCSVSTLPLLPPSMIAVRALSQSKIEKSQIQKARKKEKRDGA